MDSITRRRVAVVTGGARGIGRAIGEWFLRRDHRVALLDRDGSTLARTAEAMARPLDVLGVTCDVSDAEQRSPPSG